MKWFNRLLGREPKKPHGQIEEDMWWKARKSAFQSILGSSENMVLHSALPLFLGGFADVLEFRQYIAGSAYVTSNLIGESGQPPNLLGNYELMICTREESEWAANIISRLAKYTLEAVLEPGQTMDIGSGVPDGSNVSAFLFTEPDVKSNKLNVNGVSSGILLCIGILPNELEACMNGKTSEVLALLKQKSIFPFSDLYRRSVFSKA